MDLLWDMYLQGQASSATAAASQANQTADAQAMKIHQLQQTVDRLVLINMAMWDLIKSRTGLMESDLIKQMQVVDLRDGVADGRVTPQAATCPKCGRTINSRHTRCLYCGEQIATGAFAGL
jgi:ribosomal protein S27AE